MTHLTSPAELGYLAHQHGRDDPPELVITVAPSGAGKSTLAYAVERRLFDMGRAVYVLDGQNLQIGRAHV